MNQVKPKLRTQEELETRLMMLERIYEKHLKQEPAQEIEWGNDSRRNPDWTTWDYVRTAHEYSIKECRWALGLELI